MKKMFIVMFVVAMAVGACGKKAAPAATTPPPAEPTPPPADGTTPAPDGAGSGSGSAM